MQVPEASAERSGDGTNDGVYAEIRYASVDWLVRWVMGHGGGVSVVEPEEVRGLVRQAAVSRQQSG